MQNMEPFIYLLLCDWINCHVCKLKHKNPFVTLGRQHLSTHGSTCTVALCTVSDLSFITDSHTFLKCQMLQFPLQ